jgi:hypothetical protein
MNIGCSSVHPIPSIGKERCDEDVASAVQRAHEIESSGGDDHDSLVHQNNNP